MRQRSWVAPCACALVLACRSENADPTQTNAELGRVTQQLSEEHAEQVYCNNLLTNLSKNLEATREELALVKSQREEIAGHGATAPADANETAEGRAHNRRIEIVLVPGAAATPPPEAAGSGDASVAPPPSTDAAAPPSDGAP